jgi:hypothetical protein
MQQRLIGALDRTPHPNSAADFQAAASLPCLNQDTTLVCWSFVTCCFLESEMARLKLPPARLSVMYPLYRAYREKARRYVQTKGASRFSPDEPFHDEIGEIAEQPVDLRLGEQNLEGVIH